MIALLLKVTLIFALALVLRILLRRSSAALRHLICAVALLAAALMPLTLLPRTPVAAFEIPYTIQTSAIAAVTASAATWLHFENILLWVWLSGAVLVLARLILGHWRVARTRSLATRIGVHADIPVFEADIPVPIAVGLSSPAILLPRAASDWTNAHHNAALRHEAAHIQRKDLWTSTIAQAVCALYWFHPLAWALARELHEEQESACDDAALSAGIPPDLYAEALLAVARSARPTLTATPLIGCQMINRKTLKTRIARLIDTTLPRSSSTKTLRRVALASVAVAMCVALLSATPQAPEEKVYRVGQDGVSAPKLLARIDPEYTEEAKDAKISGTVLLSLVVGADGKAHHINVLRGLDAGLDLKAVEAVQKWTFASGQKDGEPVDVRAHVEINFKLM